MNSPVGILALQGDFKNHAATLHSLDVPSVEIRKPSDLTGTAGLILPGGESTVMGKLMVRFGLLEPIRALIEEGFPVFGTCAGMILLASEIEGSPQPKLGCMDITVRRNAYGRQIASFESEVQTVIPSFPAVRGVFIRAPQAVRTGESVTVLARHDGLPVMMEENNMLSTSFHPELTGDTRVHEYFLEKSGILKRTSLKNA